MANDEFSEPLDTLIPQIPSSFFLPSFGSGSPPLPQGSVSVGVGGGGGASIEPFLGEGRSSQRTVSTLPPPIPRNGTP